LELEQHAAARRSLVPEGESPLERLVLSGELTKAMDEISRLAMVKDDPYAWKDLALGFRSGPIRRPVEEALKRVGPERVLKTIEHNPSPNWPTNLIEFLQREVDAARPKRPTKREPLPHEQSGFSRPRGFDD
jgi:hypothetical protein